MIIDLLKIKISLVNGSKPDLIIPAPSQKNSILNRGFDSTFYLAKLVSEYTSIPLLEVEIIDQTFYKRSKLELLKRIDSGLPRFKQSGPKKHSIYSAKVLIIDDVVSTGATVLGISKSLLNLGASQVLIISVAQSRHFNKMCLNLLHREGINS